MDFVGLFTPYLTSLALVAVILLATWLAAWLVSVVIGRLMRPSMPLVAVQARRAGWLIVWVVGLVLAIQQLGVNSTILLLAIGLGGVALLIALRGPLENFAARYFSDVYLPFQVGDTIRASGHLGKVIEVNSMSTILLGDDDTLVAIPNSAFLKEPVVNTTPQAWKQLVIPIAIGGSIDLPEFESATLKSVNKLRAHLDDRFPPILSTRSRTPQSTELALTVMIRDPAERDAVAAEVNRRVSDVLKSLQRRRPKAATAAAPT